MSFDAKARDWDKDPQKVERAEVFAREMRSVIGSAPPLKALEFGSGTGLVSFAARDLFSEIILADTSAGMTEVLKEKIKNFGDEAMKPMLISSTPEIVKAGKVNAIYTLLTLHHVRDISEAFDAFAQALDKDGLLFIGDLVTEDGSFHSADPAFEGHRGFDPREMISELEKKGFKTVTLKILFSILRDTPAGRREYPLFFLALRKS